MAREPTAFIAGVPRLALDSTGRGELLVFVHGIGGNRHQWRQQLVAFAPEFLACAVDVRGYGDSDAYQGTLRFATLVDDLQRVIDFFGRRPAHLVGHSMGGRIARNFALAYPQRVASLVLANSSPGFDALTAEQAKAF